MPENSPTSPSGSVPRRRGPVLAALAAGVVVALAALAGCSVPADDTDQSVVGAAASNPATGQTTKSVVASATGGQLTDDQTAFPGDADIDDAEKPDPVWDRSVFTTFVAKQGIALRDGYFHGTDDWSSATGFHPAAAPAKQKSLLVNGVQPGYLLTYQIYDAGNKATGYWIGAKFFSPSAGVNRGSCYVYQGDPMQDSPLAKTSPYTCDLSNIRGMDPNPVITVDEVTVVTNQQRAKELLDTYCTTETGGASCAFVDFGYGTELQSPAEVSGNPESNHRNETDLLTLIMGTEVQTSDSVGVGVSSEASFFDLWTSTISATYNHTWTKTQSFSESVQVSVSPGHTAYIMFAPRLQTSTGTWVVTDSQGDRYAIPSVSIVGALPNGGDIATYECPTDKFDFDTDVCSESPQQIDWQGK